MIKITNLELENIKRIKAIQLTPSESGLTVIGGNNGQGKTSVLDGIAWALGGDKFKPSQPQRDGSVIPPHLRVTLSNGLIVERKGDRGTLKITDPNGGKGGQQLLNEFIGQLALDLPKFMQATSKEKAQTLLRIIGVGDKLAALEQQEQNAYNQRRAVGQVADQKQKYADGLPDYPEAPAEEISISELLRSQQEILARNGENQRLRQNRDACEQELLRAQQDYDRAAEALAKAQQAAETARKSAADLTDESTAEIEENIHNIDVINAKVRANRERSRALTEAQESLEQYDELTAQIAAVKDDSETQIPAELLENQKDIAGRLAAAKEKLYKARAAQDIRKRIAELEAQQKSLAEEYATCEKGEYLCEQFIRAKVSLLDERINSRFDTLKFKLFHEQQNGGLQEICKVLIPCESGLVEYEKANNAARINAGIEIVNALDEYFGVALPVFCDNAESVTALKPSGGQAIRLIVSEADKVLRFGA